MADIQQEIESYIRNEMSSEERRAFELRIEKDADLRREVDEIAVIAQGVKYAARNRLRQMAERAGEEFRGKKKGRRSTKLWLIVSVLVIMAGLLWLGYSYFGQSRDTTPKQDSQEEINSGMASESSSTTEHDLSMSGKTALFSESVTISSPEGHSTGNNILVNIYRDENLPRIHYLLEEDIVNFYLPKEVNFEFPPLLFQRSDSLFIKTTTETIPLIKDGTLRVLGNQ